MAGIYLHIPFCKQACHYCDFHFSTSLQYKDELLLALGKEIRIQKDYLNNAEIESIYFGGGTPSLLSGDEISRLLECLENTHTLSNSLEVTLEANPDDLTPRRLKELKNTPVNRFSIGVQSFYNEDLKWMNRAHNASEAESAIKAAQDAGFENLSADLIYGFPLLTSEKWRSNIDTMAAMQVPHLSAYSMTVEPQTALGHFIKNGKQPPMNEGQSAEQFLYLVNHLKDLGYEQYEISNYALNENYAVHNSNYWKGVPYLGLGPSAHSFRPGERQWNVSNNAKYIKALGEGKVPFEKETLTEANQVNEYLMTSLRTKWGIDPAWLKENFKNTNFEYLDQELSILTSEEKLIEKDGKYALTLNGKLLADAIAAQLFTEEDEV